jgi:release factor glutamine methyltransferase
MVTFLSEQWKSGTSAEADRARPSEPWSAGPAPTLPTVSEPRYQASDPMPGGETPSPTASGGSADLDQIATRLRLAGCVFAEDEARLLLASQAPPRELELMVERRVSGEPLEHILGWAEFCGRKIIVEPGVFVPRRRTEFLVEQAATIALPGDVVVDLCCGSGAISAALLARAPEVELYAADIDPTAVRCARRNIGSGGRVCQGDLYQALPDAIAGRVDLLLCNAPYVPTEDIAFMPGEARLYEPVTALDGGPDGLDVQRRVVAEAPRWLAAAGHLVIETSRSQASSTAATLERAGLVATLARSDDLDATVAIGRKPGPSLRP